jgi:hypothetical protein
MGALGEDDLPALRQADPQAVVQLPRTSVRACPYDLPIPRDGRHHRRRRMTLSMLVYTIGIFIGGGLFGIWLGDRL